MAPEAAAHAVPLPPADPSPDLGDLRADGLAASEEDMLLVALFGEEANRLLRTLRGRGDREDGEHDGLERSHEERIRQVTEIFQGSDVGEMEVEDAGLRITLRRQDERPQGVAAPPSPATADNGAADAAPSVSTAIKIESPMVGTFYRSASPTTEPFVEEGDRVEVGQTLCILEAMKLFNELKSEHTGVIRAVLVNNAEPVEYGQALFELEPA
jgi:acetyl-CoA carboxylase biotin carboxyl carrier protein